MLMRTDPFRELDRLTQQVLGTARVRQRCRWTRGGRTRNSWWPSICPGLDPDSVDLDVERNVLTVRAQRPDRPARTPN